MQFAKNNDNNIDILEEEDYYSCNNNNNNSNNNNNNSSNKNDSEFLKEFLNNKPKEFIEFLNNNNIPIDSYNVKDIPRFIRVKQKEYDSSNDKKLFINSIEEDLNTKLIPILWLPYFYKLENSSLNISNSKSYKSGIIYGMDASSGAAILALNPKPGDNVLDICCAPGTKLCMISDMINGNGTITGVDISYSRLGICKSILNKYKIPNIRLFCTDGTTFNSLAPNKDDPIPKDIMENRKKQKIIEKEKRTQKNNTDNNNTDNNNTDNNTDNSPEISNINNGNFNSNCSNTYNNTINSGNNTDKNIDINSSKNSKDNNNNSCNSFKKRKLSKKRIFDLKDIYFSNQFYMRYSSSSLYDKVIVDAECSLDASIRHLIKYSKMGRYYELEKSRQLSELQKGLIDNGFKLLKVGGSLVYSTCSFSKYQNEEIVQFLLNRYKDSIKLIPAFEDFENNQINQDYNNQDSSNNINNDQNNDSNINQQEDEYKIPYSIGYIPNTYRFYPKNGTSGMFISKFQKLKDI